MRYRSSVPAPDVSQLAEACLPVGDFADPEEARVAAFLVLRLDLDEVADLVSLLSLRRRSPGSSSFRIPLPALVSCSVTGP